MEVIIKEFDGDVKKSLKRGKRLDPFKEPGTVINALLRIMNNPEKTLTLIDGKQLANTTILGDRIVIVKGYNAKGVVPARIPIEDAKPTYPKATVKVGEFFADDEIGKFFIIPVIADKKPKPATVEDLAKHVGKKVKVASIVGANNGAKIEFLVSGLTFSGIVTAKGRDYTARSIVKTATSNAIKTLNEELKSGSVDKVYRQLAGEEIKIDKSMSVRNIVYLAKNFRYQKELKAVLKKMLKRKIPTSELKLSVSKFLDEYEREEPEETSRHHVVVKIAGILGKLPEEDERIGYAVLSKGKKTVFTGEVEVLKEISVGGMKLYIVEAPFGHEFKDTKITGSMPLSFAEFEEMKNGVGGYTAEFLKFILS